MQITWLPQSMCDDLDKTVRRFIWKGTGDSGMHLVGWNKITQPRRFGGLGVRIARLQNVSLLGKLVWEILHSPSKLWVNIVKEKYLKGRLIFNASVTGGSAVWNSVVKALNMLQYGFKFKIGDGNSKFWYEPWVFKDKLCSKVPFVDIHDTIAKINEVWQDERWKLENLYTIIPESVKEAIYQIQPCIVDDLPDVWVWQHSSSGTFTSKDAYEWLLQPLPINNHVNWKWIWQSTLPANIQFFAWQVFHGSIPTREMLHHRRVGHSSLCLRCSLHSETIDHCLFRCPEAACVWKAHKLEYILPSTQNGDLFSWCRNACKSHGVIVLIVMWVVWCARNNFIFNGHRDSVHNSVAKVNALRSLCDVVFVAPLLDSAQSVMPRQVAWSRPEEGTICLNVDGSLLGSVNTAGFGGILRNNTGAFLGGFYGMARQANILYAEIMAVLHGLDLCWTKGYREVICYSDSLLAVSLINKGVHPFHSFANEINKIRQLKSRAWNVLIEHTLREGNKCADVLAKIGASSNAPLVVLSDPPLDLVQPLQDDARGVTFVRA
jgi:ribonuclease HI